MLPDALRHDGGMAAQGLGGVLADEQAVQLELDAAEVLVQRGAGVEQAALQRIEGGAVVRRLRAVGADDVEFVTITSPR